MKLYNMEANASGGVTEQAAQSLESQTEESPSSEITTSENEGGQQDIQEESPRKKGDARYQKLANENREYRKQIEEYRQHQDAIEFNKWVRNNPKAASAIQAVSLAIMNNKDPVQALSQMVGAEVENKQVEDPYSGFDPEVAEKFRRLDAIEKRLAEEDRARKEAELRSIEEHKSHLDEIFEDRLKKDGFIAKDGSYNEEEIELLSDAVISRAARIARNPERITEQEIVKAYDQVTKGLQVFEKRGLKKTVQVAPPPTPSNRGVIPIGKTKETEDQRLERITREFLSAKGA